MLRTSRSRHQRSNAAESSRNGARATEIVDPAGHGRSAPNSNPYLPPTTGRMAFSYNPLALCSALLGPRLAFQVICCTCCVLCMVVMGIVGMYFTSYYTVLESLGVVDD